MDAKTVRQIVSEHPEGVIIRLVDGTTYKAPHRDYLWFTPAYGQPESRGGRYATTFGVYDGEGLRWVNALLVAEVTPMERNGKGRGNGRKGRQGE